jgi:hypothetical protein
MKEYRYDPFVTGVFVGIGLLVIWYFSSLAIEKKILPFYFDHIFRFISILGGAFVAFRFNSMLEGKRQERERERNKNSLLLDKIEHAIFKIHAYSRSGKKYLWSIKRDNQDIIRDKEASTEARELIYEIEVYKNIYFEEMPLDPSALYAELERLAGECDKHWMRVPKGENTDIQPKLDACKSVANEVQKLDALLAPVLEWCLKAADSYKEVKT